MAVLRSEQEGHYAISGADQVARATTFSPELLEQITASRAEHTAEAQPKTSLTKFLEAELARQVQAAPQRIFVSDTAALLEAPELRAISNLCTAMSTSIDVDTGVPTHGIEQLYQLTAQWLTAERLQSRTAVTLEAQTLLAADPHYPSAQIQLSLAESGGQNTLLIFNKKIPEDRVVGNNSPICRIEEVGEAVVVHLTKVSTERNGSEPFPLHLLAAVGLSQLSELIAHQDHLEHHFIFTGEQQQQITTELAAVHQQLLQTNPPATGQVQWYDRELFTESFDMSDLQANIRAMIGQNPSISREVLQLWSVLRPVFSDHITEVNEQTLGATEKTRIKTEEVLNIASIMALLSGFTASAVLMQYSLRHESELQQIEFILSVIFFVSLSTLLITETVRSQKSEISH